MKSAGTTLSEAPSSLSLLPTLSLFGISLQSQAAHMRIALNLPPRMRSFCSAQTPPRFARAAAPRYSIGLQDMTSWIMLLGIAIQRHVPVGGVALEGGSMAGAARAVCANAICGEGGVEPLNSNWAGTCAEAAPQSVVSALYGREGWTALYLSGSAPLLQLHNMQFFPRHDIILHPLLCICIYVYMSVWLCIPMFTINRSMKTSRTTSRSAPWTRCWSMSA
jgi:hypothetical protein